MQTGGSGKAEGFADGEWANPRQASACRCHPTDGEAGNLDVAMELEPALRE